MTDGLDLIGLFFCDIHNTELAIVKSKHRWAYAVACRADISRFAVSLGYSRA